MDDCSIEVLEKIPCICAFVEEPRTRCIRCIAIEALTDQNRLKVLNDSLKKVNISLMDENKALKEDNNACSAYLKQMHESIQPLLLRVYELGGMEDAEGSGLLEELASHGITDDVDFIDQSCDLNFSHPAENWGRSPQKTRLIMGNEQGSTHIIYQGTQWNEKDFIKKMEGRKSVIDTHIAERKKSYEMEKLDVEK